MTSNETTYRLDRDGDLWKVSRDRGRTLVVCLTMGTKHAHQYNTSGPFTDLAPVKPEKPLIVKLNTLNDFRTYTEKLGLRPDWHEPDEQGINVRIIGTHLDNAMGTNMDFNSSEHGEFCVVLTKESYDGYSYEDIAVVNLATLLSWAAGTVTQ